MVVWLIVMIQEENRTLGDPTIQIGRLWKSAHCADRLSAGTQVDTEPVQCGV